MENEITEDIDLDINLSAETQSKYSYIQRSRLMDYLRCYTLVV